MNNAIVRIQNGCFESKTKPGTFYFPGLGQVIQNGAMNFFLKPSGVNPLNILDFNPQDGKSFNNTITKVERTPEMSKVEAWKCKDGESEPTKEEISLPNPPGATCTSAQLGSGKDGCSIAGGHSCDIHITNGVNNTAPIQLSIDYWQADFKTGNLLDFACKSYSSSSLYNSKYDGAFKLKNSDILALTYGCGECDGVSETLKVMDVNLISAISLVPGGIDVSGCQTNPGFGYCNLLQVENNFFS
jgi:hypothetical protein